MRWRERERERERGEWEIGREGVVVVRGEGEIERGMDGRRMKERENGMMKEKNEG